MRGDALDGFVALDDLDFISDYSECPTEPPYAEPVYCKPEEFECTHDHTCISLVTPNHLCLLAQIVRITMLQEKVCDFWNDCAQGEDEKLCPLQYLFENCEESLCYWNEEPTDELDWVIASGFLF